VKRLYEAMRRRSSAEQRCELCALPLAPRHDHLFDVAARAVRCACRGCATIVPSAERATLRRVPERHDRLDLDSRRWLARLGIPVGIAALVVQDDGRARVGFPGPAGLVDSELDDEVWHALVAEVPVARARAPEVEAIVWSTLDGGGAWRVGIDVVFEMIAALRASWRGVAGGPEASAAAMRVLAHRAAP
jgi:hypothetical protein